MVYNATTFTTGIHVHFIDDAGNDFDEIRSNLTQMEPETTKPFCFRLTVWKNQRMSEFKEYQPGTKLTISGIYQLHEYEKSPQGCVTQMNYDSAIILK